MTAEIRNAESLRKAYIALKIWEKVFSADDDIIKGCKRAIREYNNAESDRRIVRDYYDGSYIELIELPDWLEDVGEAGRYVMENEVIEYRPTYYDCTGQKFTQWFKVFERNGRFYAYHSVGRDV